jgi:hypothetical protein
MNIYILNVKHNFPVKQKTPGCNCNREFLQNWGDLQVRK